MEGQRAKQHKPSHGYGGLWHNLFRADLVLTKFVAQINSHPPGLTSAFSAVNCCNKVYFTAAVRRVRRGYTPFGAKGDAPPPPHIDASLVPRHTKRCG